MIKLFHLSQMGGGQTLQLSAVILYNDPQLAHLAADQCIHIDAFVPKAHVYTVRMVNLDSLEDAAALENSERASKANTEAREADLVFVCARLGTELNGWVQEWMRAWVAERTRPGGALVCLCRPGQSRRARALHGFLRTLAAESEMDLVIRMVDSPEKSTATKQTVLSPGF